MEQLSSRYEPAQVEDKLYKLWEEGGFFKAGVNPSKKPFCIVIPPPNVTGILHMGHALNNTIQDILIRYHRMKGEEALWMPGTDHAGIATQNVVEKSIAKEGLRRQDLGREAFIAKVWQWREQYGSTIIRQLKKLGASCDWQRTRFTMDEGYSKAVTEVFVRLYEKGLIYQGNYIINWCPRCQTALSDEEAPHNELQGSLYYLRYPLKEGVTEGLPYIVVATTRPETMLGDTAVAVNPKDKRYRKLIGKSLILPLVNREIKIIADAMVDMKFGTGAVKVTPAHDPDDYALGRKHKLQFINVMGPDARMNENAGKYEGTDRFEARQVIIEDLKEKDLLEKIEPHLLSAGHCYRCHTIIEPYLSKQWFVKMKPLSVPAIRAVKNKDIRFHPQRWTKIYLNWMENIQDWCISRQIWWGHRLPVYYCKNCQQKDSSVEKSKGIIVSKFKPAKCPVCGSGDLYQDEDVLDTWFSSWLWPFATFGWPFEHKANHAQKELEYFYPTSVLVTAPEIIFFWVARMIMAGFEFMGEIPFRDVYIHGTVRDIEGRKMSKSLGNIIDPLEIIAEYGTDALRFSLISTTAQGQDVFLSKERFEQGRNFANKLWNASRFILANLVPDKVEVDLCEFFSATKIGGPAKHSGGKKEDLSLVNRWILSRFYSTLKETDKALNNYNFNEAANLLYAFFWHEFCDWYLEMAKPDIKSSQNQVVMYKVLEKFLRLIHPFMPFISEELWQKLSPGSGSIMIQPWPHLQEKLIDKKTEEGISLICELITAIRNMRSELEVGPQEKVTVVIYLKDKQLIALIEQMKGHIMSLAKLNQMLLAGDFRHDKQQFVTVLKGMHVAILLATEAQAARHREKIEERIEKAKKDISNKEAMLANSDFVKRAPVNIVENERNKLAELKETLRKLRVVKNGLG